MFNPFVPLHSKMIEGFRKMKRPYLVSQTCMGSGYHPDDGTKTGILLTDYEDQQGALIHYNALTDRYRYILDLENDLHRNKLMEMIGENSRFRVYAAFVESMKKVEKKLNIAYSQKIRNYIAKNTSWKINTGTVYPSLEVTFGELFVILKYGNSRTERFRLSELEKY